MTRNEAKQLAENVSLDDLLKMFENAKELIKDWTKVSRVNKGMTLGTAYNILSIKDPEKYKTANDIHILGKTNMIWEFGEYLPTYNKPSKKQKPLIIPYHQDPIF